MKIFPVQLDEELHRRIKHAAVDENQSLHDWILSAIKEKLNNGTATETPVSRSRGRRKG